MGALWSTCDPRFAVVQTEGKIRARLMELTLSGPWLRAHEGVGEGGQTC